MAKNNEPVRAYKLWVIIEEITLHPDGSDEYRDMKEEETCSVGSYLSLDDATNRLRELSQEHSSDGDEELQEGISYEVVNDALNSKSKM